MTKMDKRLTRTIGQLMICLCVVGLSFASAKASSSFVHSSHALAWIFVVLAIGLAVIATVAVAHATRELVPYLKKELFKR